MKKTACLIIGSGPAGYTAAIYASRANLKPIMIEGLQPGGQLTTTTDVENFPGYPNGIMGPEMMEDLKNQAKRFGTEIISGFVTSVDFSKNKGELHKITVDEEKIFESKTVIISTGASAKYLGLDSEKKFMGFGVSACAVCDGFFYKGEDVVVVGGGDSAAEESIYLSKLCNKVYLLVRKDSMRASKIMQERVLKTPNIEVLFNHETIEILGDQNVNKVNVFNNITKENKLLNATGFFVAIGHKPNTDIFKGKIKMNSAGYIITHADSSLTDVNGVFASGDVQDSVYRQAVTAAGSGCMAALDAERYLSEFE
ncbi:MAG: thioredoxin-disulfide reductase [Flavobacteriales bacterium]|nr:thioredoxin-disulfide reductase [Flavobacteriales bacterium]|tara:strand:+ start:7273 stop:8208 length:936 start_codon:yes stop_codon:yes gene_type:complete